MVGDKRYRTLKSYLTERYGFPVRKISIDAGFTCPNRNGSLGEGGCIYCSNESFVPQSNGGPQSITTQIQTAQENLRSRLGIEHAIAYFQAFTNTYARIDVLRRYYDEAVAVPGIVGLSVGTRPDCVADEVLALLAEYKRDDFDVWLELGLQSASDKTLQEINRGHGVAEFLDAVIRAKKHDLKICAHVILGLPNESREEMIETAKVLTVARVDGVKIHPLHVVRGTALAEMYERREYTPLELDEYVGLVCEFLERLAPDIVIHRLTGEARGDTLIAPLWCKAKSSVLAEIDKELESRDSYQGKFSALGLSAGDVTIKGGPEDGGR